MEILDAAMAALEAANPSIAKQYPHEYTVLSVNCSERVDLDIRNRQKDHDAFTSTIMARAKDNKDKEAWLEKPKSREDLMAELESEKAAAKAAAKAEAQMQALQMAGQTESEPETEEARPVESARRRQVKYAAIGFVIGALIMCLWFILRYMMNDLLVSYKDVERKGFALRELGEASGVNASMAAASIRSFAGSSRRLFLTGMAQADLFDSVCLALKKELPDYEIVCARDVLTDPKAREQLLDLDAVVLMEQKGVTRYSQLKE